MTPHTEVSADVTIAADPVSANGTHIRIRVLGACAITAGRSRIDPDSAVLFALALLLGVRAGEHVTRAEVLELLWPGEAESARRHALRQLLYRLKRSGVPLDGDGDELSIGRSAVDCDLTELLAESWAQDVVVDRVPALADVLPAYAPVVSDAYHAWIDALRARAATQIQRAALRHVALARREGRWADLESMARRCLDTDPLNEEATLALAEATAMRGSKAEALRLLDAYLLEIGEASRKIDLPAKVLRRRISDQPVYRAPRAGDPPLIARTAEIAWLNARLDETVGGRVSTAMLVGPPGIGKSAVVRTFVSHAEMRGWRFVESRLQPSDVDRPLSVFVELLPPLLKASGALGAQPESIAQLRRLIEHHVVDDIIANKSQEAEAIQARIRASMLDLIGAVAHEGGLVFVLEDMHWVDKQSLRLVTWLLDHAEKMSVLWLLTTRMEGRFAGLREALPAERVPSIPVGPLERKDAVELFVACLGQSQRDGAPAMPQLAYELTGGNPLFIREVAGHWLDTSGREELPTNLRELMRGRVARLSPMAQRVMHCCAMLGRFASVPRVSAVLEIATTELLECIEEVDVLGLLGLGGEPGSLALHDLWQEELIGTLRPASRALLHLRCGQELEIESAESGAASLLPEAARHLLAAGAKEKAVRLLETAAAHQLANGLSEDAVACLDQALVAVSSDADRYRLEVNRIEALLTIGGWQEIAKSAGRALRLSQNTDVSQHEHTPLELISVEATMLADMDLWQTVVRAARCVQSRSADDLHRATAARLGARAASNLALAERLTFFATKVGSLDRTNAQTRAQILAVETVFNTDLGSLREAVRCAEELVAIERSHGTIRSLIRALRYYTHPLRITAPYDISFGAALEAYELSVKHRLADEVAASADLLATIQFESGDLEAAAVWLDRAEPWVRRVGASYARTSATITRAMIAVEAGDISQAAECIPADVQTVVGDPVLRHRMFKLSVLARIGAARTDIETTRSCATPLLAALQHAKPFRRNEYFVASLAIAIALLESRGAARRLIAEYRDPVRDDGTTPWRELALFSSP